MGDEAKVEADPVGTEPKVEPVMVRAAKAAARKVAEAYQAIDPDLRRQTAELPLMGLTMLGRRQVAPEALPDDGRRPVVCVHGLGGHRGNFLPLRFFLRLNGRTRSYAAALTPGASFDTMAAELGAFVEEVARVNGLAADAQVDVVAHSLGGLIARLALEVPRVRARVATLVTLGTPHGGTHAARLLSTEATLHLRPGSELLQRLAAQLPWQGPPRLVSLWSRADVLLLPADTACAAGAENVELPDLSHYGFLLRPTSFQQVLAAIT